MANKNNTLKDPSNSFQDLILMLQDFWAQNECVILQPYDMDILRFATENIEKFINKKNSVLV